MSYRVSKAEFDRHVESALSTVPEQFAAFLEEVPIEIKDRPTRKQLRSVGLKDDELLLGLYTGRPLPDRSVSEGARLPDVIFLFQEDIEDASDSARQLEEEIRITVLHETGITSGWTRTIWNVWDTGDKPESRNQKSESNPQSE